MTLSYISWRASVSVSLHSLILLFSLCRVPGLYARQDPRFVRAAGAHDAFWYYLAALAALARIQTICISPAPVFVVCVAHAHLRVRLIFF